MRREWREASDLKPSTAWLALVVVAAAALRFWGLGRGIPEAVGADERLVMDHVVAMMKTGDLNPHRFDQPALLFYLHLPVACAQFIIGAARGRWLSLAEVGPTDLLLWARAVTALLGVATVIVVHQTGLRWGARHALLAAGLFAVIPSHVGQSHFAVSAVPATFFVALAFLFSLRAEEHRGPRAFALAGLLSGLAAATRYGAALALLLPLLTAWTTFPDMARRTHAFVATLAGFVVAFLVAAPFTLFDLPAFLDGLAVAVSPAAGTVTDAPTGWFACLGHVQAALGWPALVLLFVGLGLGIERAIKGPGRVRWALAVAFPIVFVWVVSRRAPALSSAMLPIYPGATVLVAAAVISGVSLLRRFSFPRPVRTTLIVALTVAAILPPSIGAIRLVRDLGRVPADVAGAR